MDKLDAFVECIIAPDYTIGERRAENKEYKAVTKQKDKYRRKQDWNKVKELKKIAQQMPSRDPYDENFKRLYYIRYADDCAPRKCA